MSSGPQNVIEHKVVLNLAAELGNVFRACKGNPPRHSENQYSARHDAPLQGSLVLKQRMEKTE